MDEVTVGVAETGVADDTSLINVSLNTTANAEAEPKNSEPQSEDRIVDPLYNQTLDADIGGGVQELLTAVNDEVPVKKNGEDEDVGKNGEDEDVGSESFEDLSPVVQTSAKGFREALAEGLQQSLLDHYERADFELSIPPPGRTGAVRNIRVAKLKGDLEVYIEDHEKHIVTGNEVYISYKVCAKTTRRSVFQQETYEVWRRYNDFDWLHRQLLRAHPAVIVPPLPGKQLSKFLNHLSPEFIRDRKMALATFLTRLAEHPILTFDNCLKMFLIASSEEFVAFQLATQNSGLWSGFTDSVQKATTSFWLRNPDPEFTKQMKYVNSLSEKLAVMEKTGNRLQEERIALVAANKEFSPMVKTWANTDIMLAGPLNQLASCNTDYRKASLQLNVDNMLSFQHKIREYQLYCATVQSALKNRDRVQLTSDSLLEEKAKKMRARDEAKAAAKESRLLKLEKELETVTIQSEKALDNLAKCNGNLRVDIQHWHIQKDADFCQMMTQTADNHIDYHQKCFTKWEDLLRTLRDFKTSNAIETFDGPSSDSESSAFTSDEH